MTTLTDDWSDVLGTPRIKPEPNVVCVICKRDERAYQKYREEVPLDEGYPERFIRRDIPTHLSGGSAGTIIMCPWCAAYVHESYRRELDESIYKSLWSELEVLRDLVGRLHNQTRPEALKTLQSQKSSEPEDPDSPFDGI